MVALISLTVCLPLLVLSVIAVNHNRREIAGQGTLRLLVLSELGAAWFLGLIFLSGGMSKLMPFPGVIGPVWLEAALAEHGLGLFGRFIAWSEALIGLLLLSKQTRVLGAIMLVPLLLNILMVTVSLQWRGTPWVIMFFIANNLFLLAFHYNRWRPILDVPMDWLRVARDATKRDPGPHMNGDETHGDQGQTRRTVIMALACLTLIGISPLLYRIHWILSTTIVATGLVGLFWAELQTRFRRLPE